MNRQEAEDIARSLKIFSKISKDVLRYLRQYDYSCERSPWPADERLIETPECPSLTHLVSLLRRYIVNSPDTDNPLPETRLLDAENLRLCAAYINQTKDKYLAQSFQDIPREPIRQTAHHFRDLGITEMYKELDNILQFIDGIRNWYYAIDQDPGAIIRLHLTVKQEALTPEEKEAIKDYSEFDAIFKKDQFDSPQRHALYDSLQSLYTDPAIKKPHLVIICVIAKLRKQKAYRNPLKGTFESNKKDVFRSLGKDPDSASSYRANCLQIIAKEHQDKASAILAASFSISR